MYSFRQRSWQQSNRYLRLDEAQIMIAQDTGFSSWAALLDAVATGASPIPPFVIDTREHRIVPRRQITEQEWEALIDTMKQRRLTSLDAGGLMTDAVLARVAPLSHVTTLGLSGSRQITDDGVLQLARMPQLKQLDLTGVPVTDRGLEVLRHLPNLRRFEMTWARGISDAGVAHLRFCDALEEVNLMGSQTGDGAIAALQGKPKLRVFRSGRLVTDAGLPLLHDLPHFARGTDASLLLDGPFTDAGFAALAGLEGIADLDLFWHVTELTTHAFAQLATLPNLVSLGADGRLSDNRAMAHIAALPRLRKLRAQESEATDEGFEALSRSTSLESLWGRECTHFGTRGFRALSKMPRLREMGIGCKNVADDALAAFPEFPALESLTPIGVTDPGFRHIGRCAKLVRLTCMYCRDTTDVATAHITALPLRYYYAGLTLITDRSLELLGRMTTVEQIEFYETKGITNAGLPFLAALPQLREVTFDSVPGVTLPGTRVFPSRVRVRYTT